MEGVLKDLTWEKAIFKVLTAADEALHYTKIADLIEEQGMRRKLGATPANSVNMTINKSINEKSEKSPYVRLGKGVYWLRVKLTNVSQQEVDKDEYVGTEKSAGVIQCLGMYWQANEVEWKTVPKILGQQSPKSDAIDFCDQVGIYLLHDRDKVIYVGRVNEPRLGVRLAEHKKDRFNGRWNRFSWFGLRPVHENGGLGASENNIGQQALIAAMEAILIESLEPPQNMRRGDNFKAVEYIQTPKPAISAEKAHVIEMLLKGN